MKRWKDSNAVRIGAEPSATMVGPSERPNNASIAYPWVPRTPFSTSLASKFAFHPLWPAVHPTGGPEQSLQTSLEGHLQRI